MEITNVVDLFTIANTGMRKKDFDIAAKNLISCGILEEVYYEGSIYIRLTSLGKKLYSHLDSNKITQN